MNHSTNSRGGMQQPEKEPLPPSEEQVPMDRFTWNSNSDDDYGDDGEPLGTGQGYIDGYDEDP